MAKTVSLYSLPAFLSYLSLTQAASLYASHYSGNLHLLTFTNNGNSYSLANTAQIRGGGALPAWLTWESSTRTLYCSDETWTNPQGSISAYSAAADGRLTETGKANAPQGGVANVLYGGTDGKGYIAIAHYQTSTVSTFKLPITSSSKALQTLKFTMNGKGPNPNRQEAPHPHHVVVDPTGNFLLAPDLGADLIRVWSIDKNSGMLTSCNNVVTAAGAGPRHATFWVPPGSSSRIKRAPTGVMMYVAQELANSISAWTVTYPSSGCPTFSRTQDLNPFPNNKKAPAGTKVAEVHVFGNFLLNSNRVDKSFSGNDSMASWTISSTGAISFSGFTTSWGTYPRTFSINKAGDFVAIGDQTTSNVAIVKRDLNTGLLGDLVANLRIGNAGTPENEDGLSSVVWAD